MIQTEMKFLKRKYIQPTVETIRLNDFQEALMRWINSPICNQCVSVDAPQEHGCMRQEAWKNYVRVRDFKKSA